MGQDHFVGFELLLKPIDLVDKGLKGIVSDFPVNGQNRRLEIFQGKVVLGFRGVVFRCLIIL